MKNLSVWDGTLALIRFRPSVFIIAMAGGIFMIASRLIPGWLQKGFFDQLTGELDGRLPLWGFLALIVLVELARMVNDITGEVQGANATRMAGQALMRRNIIRNILDTPGAQPLPVPTGDVINRMDDDLADFADFPTWLPILSGHAIFSILGLFLMIRIAPTITLVAILPLIGVFFLNRAVWHRFLGLVRQSRVSDSAVTAFLGETFGAIQAMKVAGAEKGINAYFRTLNEKRRKANVRFGIFLMLFRSISDNMGDIAVAVMVVMSGVALRNGDFTVGDFVLFSSYLFFLSRFPAEMGSFISEVAQQRVVLDRMRGITPHAPPASIVTHRPVYDRGEPLPVITTPTLTKPDRLQALTVRGLCYQFPENGSSDNAGIIDAAFSLPAGSFTVITGRVGAGKTTLLRVLLGLLPRQRGEIMWNGVPVTDPAAFFVPPRAAYTPQVPRLCSERLRDNILLGLPEDDVLQKVMETAVLTPDIAQLEAGLDTVVGPRGVRLSGGQVQRTAVARMLARPAELLVLDDVSSALDVETERLLWERIGKMYGDKRPTLLVVSHRPLVWEMADQMLVMEDGRIVAQGPPAQLKVIIANLNELVHDFS